jgi:hypothetical protein
MSQSSFYDFLLGGNTTLERQEMDKRISDYNKKSDAAKNRSKLFSKIGSIGIPALLAATGVGAPIILALAAGGGSLLGSKIGESGMPKASKIKGSGEFFNPQRRELHDTAKSDQKGFRQGQIMNAITDGVMAYMMPELFADAGGGLKNLFGKITGGGGLPPSTSANVLPQSIMDSINSFSRGDNIGIGTNRGVGLLDYLEGTPKYQLPKHQLSQFQLPEVIRI